MIMAKTTKTYKYRIVKPVDVNEKLFRYILNEVQSEIAKASNFASTKITLLNGFKDQYLDVFNEKYDFKMDHGKAELTYLSNQIKNKYKKLDGETYAIIAQNVMARFKAIEKQLKEDYISAPSFRQKQLIPVRDRSIKIKKINEKLYQVSLRLFSKEYGDKLADGIELIDKKIIKKNGKKETIEEVVICKKERLEDYRNNQWITFIIKADDKSQKAIIDRIIDGEYKIGTSQIEYDRKKPSKKFFSIAYTFDAEDKNKLNPDRIMGIDVGINTPAYLAISDMPFYKREVGSRKEVDDYRKRVENEKKRLQRMASWVGEGNSGRGRRKRLTQFEQIGNKIRNFKKLKNHCWSKYIVEQAVRNKCGVIQMEDLEGISKEDTFLKDWTFFELQEFIKYKAQEKGIKVVKVNPRFTSQRCSKCGFIASTNRNPDGDNVKKFKCQSCGYETDADFNAARNLATKNIDKIIKRQLNKQNFYKNNTEDLFEEFQY